MDLEQIRALLTQARQHQQPAYEPSIFAFGGRGYYENPTTDLLAFFLDPAQRHGLGDCFLRSLLSCLDAPSLPQTGLRLPPQREVTTAGGNRIDLLLHGEDWLLVLENKIMHSQMNPFADYEQHARSLATKHSNPPLYVVLSPSGKSSRRGWLGLSYARLIKALRGELAHALLHRPFDKWQVLVEEFLLHLENTTTEKVMPRENIEFIFDNLPQINALNKMRDKAFDTLNSNILARLEADVPGYVAYTRRHTWVNGPALRYACNDWTSWSDVVLYLNCSQSTLRPFIRVYLIDVNEALMEQGRALFTQTSKEPWIEGKSILGFEWKLEAFNEEVILEQMVEKMNLLMHFENDIRPGCQDRRKTKAK